MLIPSVRQNPIRLCLLASPDRQHQENAMNKDQAKGRIDEVQGKLKEVAGKIIEDKDLQAEGTIQKVGGKVQAGYGDIKADLKKLGETK
jgi:uncharacterized protein YjbJ (UPF0337 family)